MNVPDHRRIGRQLKIFATDEACGAGLPLWLPAGAVVRSELEQFIVDLERRHGYSHVYTPMLGKRELFQRSGHWAHYAEDMYPPMAVGGDQVLLRPMNCPHHILVFASEPRSLRDLPLRLAELGTMFRDERSGVVGGLSRVRQMTLNDGHVFCAAEQVEAEIVDIVGMVGQAYRALDIPPPALRLSLGGEGSKYVDNPEMWSRSEAMMRSALAHLGAEFVEARGEAAFYGPKIDLQVTDPQGREETLSTIQVDFHMPECFDLTFARGEARELPVMVHRSIVSTMERMVAHLLEAHDGSLPVWLAPVQAVVLPVSPAAVDAAVRLKDDLRRAGVRAHLDDRDATLAARVRDAQKARAPYLAVVGDREAAAGTVSVRLRGSRQLHEMQVKEFVDLVEKVKTSRTASPLAALPVA
ncbi:MAG TPA: threonine--tRNA ligase [Acidimicrobiales bacterium]|nr:threonine--tRNA ligase [Acidimicrobiales bacterium]